MQNGHIFFDEIHIVNNRCSRYGGTTKGIYVFTKLKPLPYTLIGKLL